MLLSMTVMNSESSTDQYQFLVNHHHSVFLSPWWSSKLDTPSITRGKHRSQSIKMRFEVEAMIGVVRVKTRRQVAIQDLHTFRFWTSAHLDWHAKNGLKFHCSWDHTGRIHRRRGSLGLTMSFDGKGDRALFHLRRWSLQ